TARRGLMLGEKSDGSAATGISPPSGRPSGSSRCRLMPKNGGTSRSNQDEATNPPFGRGATTVPTPPQSSTLAPIGRPAASNRSARFELDTKAQSLRQVNRNEPPGCTATSGSPSWQGPGRPASNETIRSTSAAEADSAASARRTTAERIGSNERRSESCIAVLLRGSGGRSIRPRSPGIGREYAVDPENPVGSARPACRRVAYDHGVELRFYIDPLTDEPHIYRHDVTEGEVEEVLRNRGDDFPGHNETRIALGSTSSGRHLQVIYLPEPVWDALFVITAYDLRGKALAAFRRRRSR